MTRDLTATPEYRAFLVSVIAAPDDDAPRLALADWMEEQGDAAKAEFIRVQIEQSKYASTTCTHGGGTKWSPCCWIEKLRRRERDLIKSHFWEWTESLPEELTTKQCPICVDYPADWETNVVECRRCESTGVIGDGDKLTFRRGFIEAVTCDWPTWRDHGDAILASNPIQEVTLTSYSGSNFTEVVLAIQYRWHFQFPHIKRWILP